MLNIYLENSSNNIESLAWGIWKFKTFPISISQKENVIAWVKFELVYFEAAVEYFNRFASRTTNSYTEKLILITI